MSKERPSLGPDRRVLDEEVAAELWHSYAGRLIGLARRQLSHKLDRRIDPEDIVQSAYRSFFGRIRDGRLRVEHGDDLWQVLATLVRRKVQRQVERHYAAKRTIEREVSFGSESSLNRLVADDKSCNPGHADVITAVEELERVMAQLLPLHRRIVALRLQGHRISEVAEQASCSERTVRRALGNTRRLLDERREEIFQRPTDDSERSDER